MSTEYTPERRIADLVAANTEQVNRRRNAEYRLAALNLALTRYFAALEAYTARVTPATYNAMIAARQSVRAHA